MKILIQDLFYFILKQAYACAFGAMLLFAILLTAYFWPEGAKIARYDALFIFAVCTQIVFVTCKLESWKEVQVIFIFHMVGTIMELFKTHAGSWVYPEENLIRIAGVPLFSGFMYSAVGSYIARTWRIFDFRFTHYPAKSLTVALCFAIYINFFTHHYIMDMRYVLFMLSAWMFWRSYVYYRPHHTDRRMPLMLGFCLVAFFIWGAENISTFASIWVYPNQSAVWHLVPLTKMGSWFLLMIISFVLITLIHSVQQPASDADD